MPSPLRLQGTEATHALLDSWKRSQATEPLSPADVSRILTVDPGLILATPSKSGVIAVTLRNSGGVVRGHIRLLAVDASHKQQGEASGLLDFAEAWLAAHGASVVRWGAEVPWYLWPGIDTSWHAAVTLARARGYRQTGEAVNLSLATRFRASTPSRVGVAQLSQAPQHAARVTAARAMVAHHWEPWLVEFDLAVAAGTLFVAIVQDTPVAFLAHSTLRRGWIGPMGTAPQYQGQGIGAALLSAVCSDLTARGVATAEITWVGPVAYFTRLGARRYRTFAQMEKSIHRS